MSRIRVVVACSLLLTASCAHVRREEVHTTTAVTAGEPDPTIVEVEAAPAAAPPPIEKRPRLSQTITLGQGRSEEVTPVAPAQAGQTQTQTQNVIVNNTIVVPAQPYYGGYGGYAYGGGYGGYGRADGRPSAQGGSHSGSQWGSTGWEGARRTAAPGRTPGVGGNWSPPPSHGPASMK